MRLFFVELNKKKLCAVFTTVCFLVSVLCANLYAISAGQKTDVEYETVFNKLKCINSEYGKITSTKDVGSDITIVNIQDLHCHPQTQKNISKIISQIADNYNLTKICVEGGYGKINTDVLNTIKDKSLKKQIIENLLEQGILTGSEYYKLTKDNNVNLIGLDDEKIHKNNIKRLAWIIDRQEKYENVIDGIKKEISILGNIYVNKINKNFNKTIESYYANKINSRKFYKQLIKYVEYINNNPKNDNDTETIMMEDYPNIQNFMTLNSTSKNIDSKKVSYQISMVLNELKNRLPYSIYARLIKETDNLSDGRKVIELISLLCEKEGISLKQYKALRDLLDAEYTAININPVNLLQEERQLISEIRKSLSYNNEEYEVTYIADFAKYFYDYLDHNLTDTEWKYFKKNYNKFRKLYSKYAVFDGIKDIEKDFVKLNRYYDINDGRNFIFVYNILDKEKASLSQISGIRDEDRILKNSKKVIIAVTGGFHSSELEKILAEKNINTIVITPSIHDSAEKANEKYTEIIEQQSKINSQALAYTLFSCSGNKYQQMLLIRAAANILNIDDINKIGQILNIDTDLSYIDTKELDNIPKEHVDKISSIIKASVDDIFYNIRFIKNIIFCDKEFVDAAMLKLVTLLIEQGFYFNKGAIYDLEDSAFNGKEIKGISPSISYRMPESLQRMLLNTAAEEADSDEVSEQDLIDLYETADEQNDSDSGPDSSIIKEIEYDIILENPKKIKFLVSVPGGKTCIISAEYLQIEYIDGEVVSKSEERSKVEQYLGLHLEVSKDRKYIHFIKTENFKEGTEIYTVENIQGQAFGFIDDSVVKIGPNEDFSEETLAAFIQDSGAKRTLNAKPSENVVNIYLDEPSFILQGKIEQAASENKLIILNLFQENLSETEMSYSEILKKYIELRFRISVFSMYGNDIGFSITEMLKNAFVHGNLCRFERPVALYFKFDEDKHEIEKVIVYNEVHPNPDNKLKTLASLAGLTGYHFGRDIMELAKKGNYSDGYASVGEVNFYKASVETEAESDTERKELAGQNNESAIKNLSGMSAKDYIFVPDQKRDADTGEELTEEEKELLERYNQNQQDLYDGTYTYSLDKNLQKDVREIFDNLLNAMVSLGWITSEEKGQYKLHFYYQPTVNAFTIRNSKDVYLFSQLLFELDRNFKKQGKFLTKDIVAAILAHELRHTIQENRKYEYENKIRKSVTNKGAEKRKEYDADTGALDMMDVAGYNPKAMQKLMEFFCSISFDDKLMAIFDLLDAHPASKDRLKVVQSILESKDVAFMNIDKREQLFTDGRINIKRYFKIKPFITGLLLNIGTKLGFVRKIILDFMLGNKSLYFSSEEKEFLKNATDAQKKYIYKLMFYKDSKFDDDRFFRTDYDVMNNLSQKEREELFDFIVGKFNILKAKRQNLNILFFGKLITSMDMTQERWERLNKFRKVNRIDIISQYLNIKELWFYKNNYQNLSDMELELLTKEIVEQNERFLNDYDINKKEYIEFVVLMLKRKTPFFNVSKEFVSLVEKVDYLSEQEKLEFFYRIYFSSQKQVFLQKLMQLIRRENVTNTLINLFDFVSTIGQEVPFTINFYNYFVENYPEELSLCNAEDFKKIAVSYQKTKDKPGVFSVFLLGWFLKSVNPDKKIYFVNSVYQIKDPQYSDGMCLWPDMFKKGENFEEILNTLNVDNEVLLERLKSFQKELIDTGITNENISFIAYKILQRTELSDNKYDLKYLLCLLKNQDDVLIETDGTTIYPAEYLKDVAEILFPQASRLNVGAKYRYTQYFIHLAELHDLSIDYNDSLEKLTEYIKNHFSVSERFFKKNKNGEYIFEEQENIAETEENLKNTELSKIFIYKIHEVFGIKPVSKTIKFKVGKDEYKYNYFEINENLLKQVPSPEQVQQLVNIFSVIKKELPEENAEFYAKFLYDIIKKNSALSVFSSVEENINLLDFLFEGFSKYKDDYISELMDKFNISPYQYIALRDKTTLVHFAQQTETENTSVAKSELLYTAIESITNQDDRINFLLWLMSADSDAKYYRTYILGNVKCKNNDNIIIDFDSLKKDFLLMTKAERENVIRTIFLGSNGILNKKETKHKNISAVTSGLQNIFFNNLFFDGENTNILNAETAKMFKKMFEIVFKNVNDERKVIFVNNLFSALIDIQQETENLEIEPGELRARQLGRLIVAMGVNSGVAVLKLLQILSNNKVFEQLDEKYGVFINEEVSKVKSENEPLSKFVIFKYLERLGLLNSVEYVGRCLGSASIGLTYFVKFIGKKEQAVVKIKRPNIMKNYYEDFEIFEKLRSYVVSDESPLADNFKKMIPRTEHLRNLFQDELNFSEESDNLLSFAHQLEKRNSEINVPELLNQGDYLFSQATAKGTTLNKLSLSDEERKNIYFKILREFFTEIFTDSTTSDDGKALYHADLHEGNIFVDEQGEITFIDLGGVGKTDKITSKHLKKMFIFLCVGNYSGFISSLREYNDNIFRQLSPSDKQQIKTILEKKSPLENKFADLFEIFNNMNRTNKDFLMFMQSISKIAAYIDGLELINDDGSININYILKYGEKLFDKDFAGLDNIINEKQESLKQMAVSLYTKKYDGFIAVLNLYNPDILKGFNERQREQIENILKSNSSLRDKIKKLIKIFETVDSFDKDLLLIFEISEEIINYIGEDDLKDIIKKLIFAEVKKRIMHPISKKQSVSPESAEEKPEKERFSLLEIVSDKCKNISTNNRSEFEQKLKSVKKEAVIKCLRNSVYISTVNQITDFIDIADYLYEKGFINERNETDKLILLFKAMNVFSFKPQQIKELFEIDFVYIDEILTVLQNLDKKRKQKKVLKKFLKEKNKLDLENLDIEIVKILLDTSKDRNSVLSMVPTDIARKLWRDEEKLQHIRSFITYNSEEDYNLALILKLIDLPNEILRVLRQEKNWGSTSYYVNLNRFCDLYNYCYFENKFFNMSSFVGSLMELTGDNKREFEMPVFLKKLFNKISNVMVLLTWKIPVLLKITNFVKKHRILSYRERQTVNIFKQSADTKTLEEIAEEIYKNKRGAILKESKRLNIPMDINNINFKALMLCFKYRISITQKVRNKITAIKDDNGIEEFKKYIDDVLEKRKVVREKFILLDEYSYIWEEIVFKFGPIIFSVFNPAGGALAFYGANVIFMAAHMIPKLFGKKKFIDALSETKEQVFSWYTMFTVILGLFLLLNGAIFAGGELKGFWHLILPGIAVVASMFSFKMHENYNIENQENPLSIVGTILNAIKGNKAKSDSDNVVKNVSVYYQNITARQAEEMSERDDTVSNIYIVEDIENISDKNMLENTGLKINGASIYKVKSEKYLIYGAKGVPFTEVAEVLNQSEQMKREIKASLSLNGSINLESVVVRKDLTAERSEENIESSLSDMLSGVAAETQKYQAMLASA